MYDSVDVFTYLVLKSYAVQMVYKLYITMIMAQYRKGMLNRVIENMCGDEPITRTRFVIHEKRFKPTKHDIPFEAAVRYKVRVFEGDYGIYIMRPVEEVRATVFEELIGKIPPQVREILNNVAEEAFKITLSEAETRVKRTLGIKYKHMWLCGGKTIEECFRYLGVHIARMDICEGEFS